MDNSIFTIYKPLEKELSLINFKWTVWNSLFKESEEQIETLNKVAPISFRFFQDSLLDDIILSMCRMLDPEQTYGNTNLTLNTLITAIREHGDKELLDKLNQLVNNLLNQTKNLKILRSKRIAHNDLESIVQNFENIPSIFFSTISETMDQIGEVLNEVLVYYDNTDIHFDLTDQAARDVFLLINCLKGGMKGS